MRCSPSNGTVFRTYLLPSVLPCYIVLGVLIAYLRSSTISTSESDIAADWKKLGKSTWKRSEGRTRKTSRNSCLQSSVQLDLESNSRFSIMDGLLAEVAAKRKAISDDQLNPKPSKYMRRGELERLREEQERKEKAEKEAENTAEKQRKEELVRKASKVCTLLLLFDFDPCPNSRMENRPLQGQLPILQIQKYAKEHL